MLSVSINFCCYSFLVSSETSPSVAVVVVVGVVVDGALLDDVVVWVVFVAAAPIVLFLFDDVDVFSSALTNCSKSPVFAAATASSDNLNCDTTGPNCPDCNALENNENACWNCGEDIVSFNCCLTVSFVSIFGKWENKILARSESDIIWLIASSDDDITELKSIFTDRLFVSDDVDVDDKADKYDCKSGNVTRDVLPLPPLPDFLEFFDGADGWRATEDDVFSGVFNVDVDDDPPPTVVEVRLADDDDEDVALDEELNWENWVKI